MDGVAIPRMTDDEMERGERRRETGDGRRETGDGRRETGVGRRDEECDVFSHVNNSQLDPPPDCTRSVLKQLLCGCARLRREVVGQRVAARAG